MSVSKCILLSYFTTKDVLQEKQTHQTDVSAKRLPIMASGTPSG